MKHKPIAKKVREQVYAKCNGHCAYCGCELEYRHMQVDHIKSVYQVTQSNGWVDAQDDSLENLMPSCRQCNLYKGGGGIEYLRNRIRDILQKTCIKPFQTQLAMKYGIITFHPWDGEFYFEKFKEEK